jgi:hypothetical protein
MKGIVRGRYNPKLLHDPHQVLRRLNIIHFETDNNGYWTLHCPTHLSKDDKHTLKLHHIYGHFYCAVCGFHGKNILDFYMGLTGKEFYEASTDLGAWE